MEACIEDLDSGAIRNDGEFVQKVSREEEALVTKWKVCSHYIAKISVDSLDGVAVAHFDLIPDDLVHLAKLLCKLGVVGDVAGAVVGDGDGIHECRVGGAAVWEELCSDSIDRNRDDRVVFESEEGLNCSRKEGPACSTSSIKEEDATVRWGWGRKR